MRRSKSNPAKYTRNYRSISQRRMTSYDEEKDDSKEIERLRNVVKQGERFMAKHQEVDYGRKRKRDAGVLEKSAGVPRNEGNSYDGVLSKEILDNQECGYGNNNDLLIVEKKKKTAKRKKEVKLTPQELKQAKQLQKKSERKLKQLEMRAAQKEKRKELYDKLQETALSKDKMELLSSSSTLGKKATKKETLKKLLNKERAGVALTAEERDLLYQDREMQLEPHSIDETEYPVAMELEPSNVLERVETILKKSGVDAKEGAEDDEVVRVASPTKKSRGKKSKKRKQKDDDDTNESEVEENEVIVFTEENVGIGSDAKVSGDPSENATEVGAFATESESPTKHATETNTAKLDMAESKPVASFFAAQMMASLTKLKAENKTQSDRLTNDDREDRQRQEELEAEKQHKPSKRYIPENTAVLKTAAALGISPKAPFKGKVSDTKVREIQRPADVAAMKYDLPVATVEFEIMDAIRNNDVAIICAETGSGKSTQVVQFLYEYGMSSVGTGGGDGQCIIGVTQPRRVAAISTAKRVCYEMGQGNGQSIRNASNGEGNLVAYQTRYETAGLGTKTHIKFMTDGILLQEIQSDLLLRKYSVIILDEAHERGLNTDVLIGLLSAALPLRKEAASEEGSTLSPLKIIIMSATLRVEDFTDNKDLFPTITPAVVRVPGRTHPVTIHHSKVTELDKYEDIAFQKICKIHRKLPQGGILVFLTGKQEIVRMVKRLRKALSPRSSASKSTGCFNDVFQNSDGDQNAPRDMDDEEVDGDIFQGSNEDDFDGMNDTGDDIVETPQQHADGTGNGIPKLVTVLPLYSLLSADDQAKVFAPVPEGHRLIVVATNVAETSITIPGISYVVDSGRQKCRNFNSSTGMASFDIMWISKASADQRAGRAGRTGPGHCYRLYSSTMYSRHMDSFALPEVLIRPLEDVVLSMKAMRISDVAKFPFPTPPDRSQISAAVNLLANIGCVDSSNVETDGGDGQVTRLGLAVSKLPLGVRYSKMLLVAAQAGVLDYAISVVAALSEATPFVCHGHQKDLNDADSSDEHSSDESDEEKNEIRITSSRWRHKGGDAFACMVAVGAYTFAGRGAGGVSEKVACRKFCEENGLNPVIMERIQKMRIHLARLAKLRLGNAEGVAAKTGGILSSLPPPTKLQERLLCQSIASGLLDHIAILAPPGSIPGEHPFSLRSAYLGCSMSLTDPLFVDRNSVIYCRDSRLLPQWVCYESLMRKTLKDGTVIAVMKNLTPVDPTWLGILAKGSRLLSVGEPLLSPLPVYNSEKDAIMCSAKTKFGKHGWEIPPVKVEMFDALQGSKPTTSFMPDDSFRWFARFLLEGKIIKELQPLESMLSDSPAIITRRTPVSKVALLVSCLASEGIDSAAALRKHWAQVDNKFLFPQLKGWIKKEHHAEAKKLWIEVVKKSIRLHRTRT